MNSEESDLVCLLALLEVEDVSVFVWLEPGQLCTAAAIAQSLIRWITTVASPKSAFVIPLPISRMDS